MGPTRVILHTRGQEGAHRTRPNTACPHLHARSTRFGPAFLLAAFKPHVLGTRVSKVGPERAAHQPADTLQPACGAGRTGLPRKPDQAHQWRVAFTDPRSLLPAGRDSCELPSAWGTLWRDQPCSRPRCRQGVRYLVFGCFCPFPPVIWLPGHLILPGGRPGGLGSITACGEPSATALPVPSGDNQGVRASLHRVLEA